VCRERRAEAVKGVDVRAARVAVVGLGAILYRVWYLGDWMRVLRVSRG
jgi:hypothetical protein